MLGALALTIILLIAIVTVWHLLFPILGGVVALSLGLWGFLVSTIVIFCITILLLFVFTGIGAIVLGIFAAVWTVVGIVLFPLFFPLLIPLLITVWFVALIRRRRQRQQKP